MTEAATSVATTLSGSEPLTTVDNIFQIVEKFLGEHRQAFLILASTLSVAWVYNRFWVNRKFFSSVQPMKDKTVLITGGNAGIGYETAKDLLGRGARVILVCRNMEKGGDAVCQLRREVDFNEKNLRLMQCDLSSLDSVRNFAKRYNNEEDRLDVLICNAGILWTQDVVTKDGFHSVIQSNYLGHFLLTNLLLDKLKASRPSRIINISSGAHRALRSIDWTDVFTQFKQHSIIGRYGASKAFQILSTHKLKKDLMKDGINSFAVNPGYVKTSITASIPDILGIYRFLLVYPFGCLSEFIFAKRPKTGARTGVYCAVAPELENSPGLYFENCNVAQPTQICVDDEIAEKLWQASAEAVQLQ